LKQRKPTLVNALPYRAQPSRPNKIPASKSGSSKSLFSFRNSAHTAPRPAKLYGTSLFIPEHNKGDSNTNFIKRAESEQASFFHDVL
jgi:hypothetical protein